MKDKTKLIIGICLLVVGLLTLIFVLPIFIVIELKKMYAQSFITIYLWTILVWVFVLVFGAIVLQEKPTTTNQV